MRRENHSYYFIFVRSLWNIIYFGACLTHTSLRNRQTMLLSFSFQKQPTKKPPSHRQRVTKESTAKPGDVICPQITQPIEEPEREIPPGEFTAAPPSTDQRD